METKRKCPIILGASGTQKTEIVTKMSKIIPLEHIACDKFYTYMHFDTSVGHPSNDYSKLKSYLARFRHPMEPVMDKNIFGDLACMTIKEKVAQDKMPLAEGCSVGYFTGLINSQKRFPDVEFAPLIGLYTDDLNEKTIKGKIKEFIELGAIREVEEAIEHGWSDSYVIKKSVIANPLYNHVKGRITLDNAIDISTSMYLGVIRDEETKFKSFPNVAWLKHERGKTDDTASRIVEIIEKS